MRHERVCNDHDYFVEMPYEDNAILKYNHGEKSLKISFMIYADLERLLEKMHSCQNNPEKSYTQKKSKHAPPGYSLFTNCSFDTRRNKLNCYKGEGCMESFCKDFKRFCKIIDYENKELILLTDKENNFYEKQKACYICKKEVSTDESHKKYI